jgi:hypothetical protein
MMRQEKRSFRTFIMVMVNTSLRRMVLKIGMEGSDFRHLLLLRSGTELPKGLSRGARLSGSFCRAAKTWRGFIRQIYLLAAGKIDCTN